MHGSASLAARERSTSGPLSVHLRFLLLFSIFSDCDLIASWNLAHSFFFFFNVPAEPAEVHRQLRPAVLPRRAGCPDCLFGQHLGGRGGRRHGGKLQQ